MSTADLVAYVTGELDQQYEKMSHLQFMEEARNYWEDSFDEVVEEVKDYMKCDFKQDRREV